MLPSLYECLGADVVTSDPEQIEELARLLRSGRIGTELTIRVHARQDPKHR